MKNIKNIIVSAIVEVVILLFVSFFIILLIPNNQETKTFTEDTKEQTENYSQYVSAIDYGTLDLWQEFKFEVFKSSDIEMVLSSDCLMIATIGLLEKGSIFYKQDNNEIYVEKDIYINSTKIMDDGSILVNYYEVGIDYILLYGCEYDYYIIDTNALCSISGIGNVKIVNKELTSDGAIFTLEQGDYHHLNPDATTIKVRIKKENNVYFILNTALTEQNSVDTYLLHIYNPYSDVEFYDKTITAYRYNDKYSIITSNNCKEYERVLITK